MKGMTKGKAEEQRQIAANLKKQGVNIETIAQCTGLSVEEIDELQFIYAILNQQSAPNPRNILLIACFSYYQF